MNILKLWTFSLRLLYPSFCCGCGAIGTLLCDDCYEKITFLSEPIGYTASEKYLDAIFAVAAYEDVLKSLIATYKYKGVYAVGDVLAKLMHFTLHVPIVNVLVPVPLHKKRLKERGFNQAEVISRALTKLCGVPTHDLLVRAHFTTPQATVKNRAERLTRLDGIFAMQSNIDPSTIGQEFRAVALIDDVTTTGTTLNECARVLKAAGVKHVFGLVVAHGN